MVKLTFWKCHCQQTPDKKPNASKRFDSCLGFSAVCLVHFHLSILLIFLYFNCKFLTFSSVFLKNPFRPTQNSANVSHWTLLWLKQFWCGMFWASARSKCGLDPMSELSLLPIIITSCDLRPQLQSQLLCCAVSQSVILRRVLTCCNLKHVWLCALTALTTSFACSWSIGNGPKLNYNLQRQMVTTLVVMPAKWNAFLAAWG